MLRAAFHVTLSVDEAALDFLFAERGGSRAAVKIACVGDSITFGSHSTGGSHTYPGQLQTLLDTAHGLGKFSVTNLGAPGATMLKAADSPYWDRPQFKALSKGKWDIVVIMLGTNDAKDQGSWGPDNWPHDCGGAQNTSLEECSFARDYKAMIDHVQTLGTTAAGPKVFVQVPPPLMQRYSIGANQTVINSVLPKLIPMIANENSVLGPIDVFSGMGGVSDWAIKFPASCRLMSPWGPCKWYCNTQSCDQCHPNNLGYAHLATVVKAGLSL
ncbi:hypothetical protein CYMTET_12166 [Cymbomonas tetramitiformis]|uniref:SGNH hydrolase-type esterase domain-containing protein n=1 Tax=Cymbomonas tetramitiformis TaxID=36881 RepID=A0AAE0GL50_9CHLO|nr:hypothetical protein CYMTET_12166 [Cymbomonas tetramitiformis]